MVTFALTALLFAVGGCSDEPMPSAASTPPSSTSAAPAKPMNEAVAQRLDAAVNQAMTAAHIPGAIIGIWGPDGDYVRAVGSEHIYTLGAEVQAPDVTPSPTPRPR